MASNNRKATLHHVAEEPTLRDRLRELRSAIGEAQRDYWNRQQKNAAEQMVAHLGKFEALLVLWGKGG